MFPWKSESVVRGNVLYQIPCTLDLGDTELCAVLLWLVMGGACGGDRHAADLLWCVSTVVRYNTVADCQ